MNWILAFILILIVIYLVGIQLKKRKNKIARKTLLEIWGKPKNEKYFDFNLINQFYKNHESQKEIFQTISDHTWNDLDLDDIFKFLDRTTSKIGQQYLYYKLRTITNVSDLKRFGKLTETFKSNQSLRLQSQVELYKLSSNKAYYLEEIFRSQSVEKSNKIWLFCFLSIAAISSIILSFFNPTWFLLLIPIFFINLVFHYKNKSSIQYYLNGVGQLATGYRVAKNLSASKEIKSFYKDFIFLKNVRSILSKIKFIEWEKKLDSEYALLLWFLSEIIKITFNLEPILFYSFQNSLKNKEEDIKELFLFIGEIDSAISCASIQSDSANYCKPNFISGKEVFTEDIYHPLIENCITNNLNLESSSLLLTGSNMSGKTTFIRTFSINAILGQTLNFCFATKFDTPFFKIYSSIRISDNLMNSTSYYLEEVVRIKELIDASKIENCSLFILDELFKGTNTMERIAAGKSILSYLNKKNHIVMVSTHDLELTEFLKDENFDLYHFSETIENGQLIFDYKIKPGKPKSGNAIKILELYDYPLEIIQNSKGMDKITLANMGNRK
ncbi:MutS-related protein [Gillisia hiemivivida]|uniref:DNA mismatch repair protein MutS n=1 Tax=Gillisia hiemivivida TaxID=291190 RepID=A0A5C6ZU18_9FLAO|nr:DNA mismatch repair protein MutS [Gillisia hiemivivida]TXD92668.1 DNA mismatch repair protein MutS [Gillisia hiemivivida]